LDQVLQKSQHACWVVLKLRILIVSQYNGWQIDRENAHRTVKSEKDTSIHMHLLVTVLTASSCRAWNFFSAMMPCSSSKIATSDLARE